MDRRRITTVVTVIAIAAAGCTEKKADVAATPGSDGPAVELDGSLTPKPGTGNDVVSMYSGEEWTFGTVPAAAVRADDSKEPLTIGMLNTDDGPIGALPELHQATDAAIEFINAELGGVGGRPLKLSFCATAAVDASQTEACARKMIAEKVPVVLNGVNISSTAAMPVLEENGVPWVGGIPVNPEEMKSPVAFSFSGGTPGSFAAFAHDAAKNRNFTKVAIMYADIAQVADGAKAYGVALLKHYGVDVKEVTFGLFDQDLQNVVVQATADSPQALIVGTADSGCAKVLQALVDLKVTATTYMVGACADKKWLDQVGGADKVKGTVFNIENVIDQTLSRSADGEVYENVIKRYGKGVNARGAGTVAFKGAMNLWGVLDGLAKDGKEITSANILASLRSKKDAPSFDGHPYTCDGKQMPGLPGLCAPQQILVELEGVNSFKMTAKEWIDVPKILSDAGITG